MSSPTKDPIDPSREMGTTEEPQPPQEMETTEEPQSPHEPPETHEYQEPLEAHTGHEHAEAVEDSSEHGYTIVNLTPPIGTPIGNVANPQDDPNLDFDTELRSLVSRIIEATRASVILGDGSSPPDANGFSGDFRDLVAKYVTDFPVSTRKFQEKEAILSPLLKATEGDHDKYYNDLEETVVSQHGRLGNLEKTVKALQVDITKTKFDSHNVAEQLASMAEDAQAVEKHNEELKIHARNLTAAKIATERKLRQVEEELEKEKERSDESEFKYQQLFDTIERKKEELVEELTRRQYPPLPEEEILSRHYKDQLWDYTIDGMAKVAKQALNDLEEEEKLIKSMREEMRSRHRYLAVIPRESGQKKPEDDPETVIAKLERRINDQDRRADLLQRMLEKAKAERDVNTDTAVASLTKQIDDALNRLQAINADFATAEEVRDLAIAQVKDSEAKISLLEKAVRKVKGLRTPFSAKSPVGKDMMASQESSAPGISQSYPESLQGDAPPTSLAVELAELHELTSHENERRFSLISDLGLPQTPRPTSELLTLRGLREERDRLTEQLEKCGEHGKNLTEQLEKSQKLREELEQQTRALKDQIFRYTTMATSEAESLRAMLKEAEKELSETWERANTQETKHTQKVAELTRRIEELTDQLRNAISVQSKDAPPEVEPLRRRILDLEQQLQTVREEVAASLREGYEREANKLTAKIQELQEQQEKQAPAPAEAEGTQHLTTIGQLPRNLFPVETPRAKEPSPCDVFSTPKTLVDDNNFLRSELEKLKAKVDPFRQKDRITEIRKEKKKLEEMFENAGIAIDPFGFDQPHEEDKRRYNALSDEEDLCHMLISGANPARRRLRPIYQESLEKISTLEALLLQARKNTIEKWGLDGAGEISGPETYEELRRELEDTRRQLETANVLHSVRAQHAQALLESFEDEKSELLRWTFDIHERRERMTRAYFNPEYGTPNWHVKPRRLIRKEEEFNASAMIYSMCYCQLEKYSNRLSVIAGLPPEKVNLRITQLGLSIQELNEHHSAVAEAINSLNSRLDERLTSPGREPTPLLQTLIYFLTWNTEAASDLHRKLQDEHVCRLKVSREIDDLYRWSSITDEQYYAILQRKNEYHTLRKKIRSQHDAALKIRDKLQSQYYDIMRTMSSRRDDIHGLPEESVKDIFEAMTGNSDVVKAFGNLLDGMAGDFRWKLRSFRDSVATELSGIKLRLREGEEELEDKKAEYGNRKEPLSPEEEKLLQEKMQYVEDVREKMLKHEELLDTFDDIRYHIKAEDELLQLRDEELKQIEKRRVELEERIFEYATEERARQHERAKIKRRKGRACPPEEIEKELNKMWSAGRPWMSMSEIKLEKTALALRAGDLLDAHKAYPFLHRTMTWPMSERILRYYPFSAKDGGSKVKQLEGTRGDEPLERFAKEVVNWRNEKAATLEIAQQYMFILQGQLGYLGVKVDAAKTKIEDLLDLRERTAHLREGSKEQGAVEAAQNAVIGEDEDERPKSPLIFASDPRVVSGELRPTAEIYDPDKEPPPPPPPRTSDALFDIAFGPDVLPEFERDLVKPNFYYTHGTLPDVRLRREQNSPPRAWLYGRPLPELGPDRFFPSLSPRGSSYAEIHQRAEEKLQASKNSKKAITPGNETSLLKSLQYLERMDRESANVDASGLNISGSEEAPKAPDAGGQEKEPPKPLSPQDMSMSEVHRRVEESKKAKAMNPPVLGPGEPDQPPKAEQQDQGGFRVKRKPLLPGSHPFKNPPPLPPRAPQPGQPATERPANEKGATEMPETRRPATQHSSAEQPAAQKPATQQPAVQKPTTQQPTTQQASTQQASTQQASTQQPATEKPATQQQPTKQPATQEPTAKKPAAPQKSTAEQPDTQKPVTQQPPTKKRGTQRPTIEPLETREGPEGEADSQRQGEEEPEAGPSKIPKDKGKGKAPIRNCKHAQQKGGQQKTKLPNAQQSLIDQQGAINERLQQLEKEFVHPPNPGCGNYGDDDSGGDSDKDDDDDGSHDYGGCGGYGKGHHGTHPDRNLGKYPEFRNQLKDLDAMVRDGTKKAQNEIAQLDEEMRKAERERLAELEEWIEKEVWKVDFHKKILEEGMQALEKSPAYVAAEDGERVEQQQRRGCGHNGPGNDQARRKCNCRSDPSISCGCDCICQFHRSHACVEDYNCKKSIARGPITGAVVAVRQHLYENVRAYVRLIRLVLVFFLWLTHLPGFIYTRSKRYLLPPFISRRIFEPRQQPPVPEPPICWPCFQAKDAVYIFYHVMLLMTIQVYVAASRERELWLFGNSRLKAAYGHNVQYGIPYFAWFFRVDPRLTITRQETVGWACILLDALLGILTQGFDWVVFTLGLILERMNGFFWGVAGNVLGHGPLEPLWGI